MADKMIPLDLPPGLRYNGTALQSKGRWYVGNLVRFIAGKIQPVGGWVQRTLTGTSISGTPNAMHSWQRNDGSVYTAVGTTTALYLISSTNVVTNITPTTGAINSTAYLAPGALQWDLTNFGEYLVAVLRSTVALPINPVFAGDPEATNVYVWTGSGIATQPYGQAAGPLSVYGCCATTERFLMLIGGGDATAYTRPPVWVG